MTKVQLMREVEVFYMKICPKCDAQNPNTAPVCKHCGANLNETPQIDDATVKEEKPPYHVKWALFLFILSFLASASKFILDIDMEEFDISQPRHMLYFVAVFVSIITCVLGFLCLKGIFGKKNLSGVALLAILVGVVCALLVIMDILSLVLMI